MVARLGRASFAAALAWLCAVAEAQSDRHEWLLQVDLDSAATSTPIDFAASGALGKLRYDDGFAGVGVARMLVEYEARLTPSWRAHVVGDYAEGLEHELGLTEAHLEWRPIPKSPNRHRLKLGAFYPDLSLENHAAGWGSDFTISSSAINTWFAEEVRTLGAEWSLQRPIGAPGSGRSLKYLAAVYFGNDPTGTLVAWKGWSLHDRQTRLNDVVALPDLPQVGPGGMFENQVVKGEPFVETDDRPGYYYGVEWRLGRRALIAALHYDNHADPSSLREGQYGWTTRFDHVGAQFELPAGVGLVVQWLDGTTVMGPIMNGRRVVDVGFSSRFMLLTRQFSAHRVSVRYDDFEVEDYDFVPLDDSSEAGRAWTVAYRFDPSDRWSWRLEWLEIGARKASWVYFGLPERATEHMLQMRLSYRL